MTRFLPSAGAALAALAIALLSAPVAYAHAVLVASDPVDGARLASSPSAVHLTFDEPITPIPGTIQVVSSTGSRVDTGATLRSGATVVDLPLLPNLPRGSYTAMWRVISADTHEVSGSISFGVGQDPLSAPSQPVPDDPLGGALTAIRGMTYLGLILGVGVSAVARLLWPRILAQRSTRTLTSTGWALLGIATIAELALAGPRSLGLAWSGVLTGTGLSQTLTSTTGALLMLRLGLVVALAGITRRWRTKGTVSTPGRRISTIAAGLCAVVVAATVAVDGHAGAGPDAPLATVVTTLHLVAMSVWLGGLTVLAVIVVPSRQVDRLYDWSKTAFCCVAALVLTGEYQAWRQISPLESLWSTRYGITLLGKLAVVFAMLGIAVFARRALTADRLRRTVPVEAALGAVVIAVTTMLVAQPPARTTYGPPVDLSAPLGEDRDAQIHVSTTRRGPITLDLTVHGPSKTPPHATGVTATLSSADAGIASLPVRWATGPAGHWRSTYAAVPLPGTWTLHITVEFSPTDAVATTAAFRVW